MKTLFAAKERLHLPKLALTGHGHHARLLVADRRVPGVPAEVALRIRCQVVRWPRDGHQLAARAAHLRRHVARMIASGAGPHWGTIRSGVGVGAGWRIGA